jgi:hypothetical protein
MDSFGVPPQSFLLFCRVAAEEKKPQNGPCSRKSWPLRHKADGRQEEFDGRCVSLPSALPECRKVK